MELTDVNTKQLISKLQTDEDGNYLITLPVGKDYAFNVNRKGYLFYSENFKMGDNARRFTLYRHSVAAYRCQRHIVLKNIFFDVNQYELKPASQVELEK